MAEENVIKTSIVANSDMSGLISDLNRVSSALTKLQQQLNVSNKNLALQISGMNRTFAETLRSTGQFSSHFVSLTSDVDKFGQQLDRGQLKLGQFFRVYSQHAKTSGGLIRDLAKQQVQLQNAIMQPLGRNAEGLMQYYVHIPRGLDEIKNKSSLVRQELAIMNKVVQEGANQLINWGKNTQWAGRQLTVGLTVPMAAFGKAASDAFRTADQELVRLTKVYGGLAATSSAELAKVRKDVTATAAELAKGYGASFNETLGLAADIAATGKQGNELLGSIKETTRLAVLGEVDRQEAMKATLAIQTAFKQNTQELSESINFLNAVENQTSTTLADLVEAIPKAGPIIKGLGGSVQDLALYLTAMREGGVSAAEGANALKSALGSLINPTQVATKMFAGFGVDLKGIVQRNAGNVTGTILELQAALDKLDPLKKQQALEQLFGKFQFARMNALFSNLGKQGSQTLQVLDLMKASSQDLANIAGRELSQVTESASGKYRRALEGLKADLAGVGEQFLTISTTLINIVDGVIKFANNLPKPIKQLLSVLGMFTATAGPIIMLTGVLGNFFGYIIKGIYHFKALFKGAEGWKLLTPEILAANRAGDLAEQTFYSDARAAAILKQALDGLIGSYTALETKIASGVIPIAPSMLTAAREVNPQHPLLSPMDTRSMAHMNPVSKMTSAEKTAQTIFGVVPGAPLVNQKIGAVPQIYMQGDLPKIPGVTSSAGISTGVVAEEAARWHAMTAALAMQSKVDIAKLKSEVGNTGLVTAELSTAYDALLPKMNELTKKAAVASAEIVAQVKAGKITADQARAQIVALNAEIEAMMGQAAISTAAQLGRKVDITKVPLTNQPVVDPKTSKVNMKELVKPGRTRELLNSIARALGVKTFGAPYSIETTRPKKLNVGGSVFYNNGDQVPGPNVNADVVPAMLTPGEFVIRRSIAQQDPAGMRALNAGQAMVVPKYINGGNVVGNALAYLKTMRGSQRSMIAKSLIDRIWPGRLTARAGANFYEAKGNVGSFGGSFVDKSGRMVTTSYVNKAMEGIGVDPRTLLASINARGGGSRLSTDVFLDGLVGSGIITQAQKRRLSKQVFNEYASQIMNMSAVNDRNNPIWSVSNRVLSRELSNNSAAIAFWNEYSRMPGSFAHPTRRSSTGFLNKLTLNGQTVNFANLEASGSNKFYHAKESSNPFIATVEELIRTGGSFFARNSGGLIPKYGFGGGINIPSWIVRNNLIRNLANTDPLHGPLQIGRYRSPLTIRNRRQGESIQYSGNYRPYTWDKGPRVGETIWTPGRSTSVGAFLTGSLEQRGRYVTEEYMRGNYDVLKIPGAMEAMKAWSQKASGTFHRGITLKGWSRVGGQMPPLPKWLITDIEAAQKSGDFSKLIGKEFIMRRSSWSSNSETAKGFGDFQLQANVKNRRVTPASEMFPELDFLTPGAKVKVNESESIFGGKFRIIGADKNGLRLETVTGPMGGRRALGGSVSSGMPYLVGENGPEMFVPRNSGGIISNKKVRGYINGGNVLPFLRSAILGSIGYAGGSAIGGAIGGGTGQFIGGLLGSSLGGFGGISKQTDISAKYDKSIYAKSDSLRKYGQALAGTAMQGGKLTSTLAKLALGVSKTNIALALGTTAALALYKAYDNAAKARTASQESLKVNQNEAKQLGISYTSATDNIKKATKAALDQKKLLEVKAAGAQQVGGGISLTVSEFNKLKKVVKETQPDIIEMFNRMSKDDVVKNAANLKAQLVAAGKSAKEAGENIFAAMSLSNKSDMATQAVTSSDFMAIIDKSTAASHAIKEFSNAIKTGADTDKKEIAASFETSLTSIDAYYNSISKVKDANGKLVYDNEAIAKTIKEMSKSEAGRQAIGQNQLETLIKQNPELENILNKSDSIVDAWAKYKLYTEGIQADLSQISGIDAQKMLQTMESIKAAAIDITSKDLSANNPFLALVKAGNSATAAAKRAKAASDAASKNAQKNADAEIKAIDKRIQKINDEYEARRKLIELQSTKESYAISLQKEQLSYQDALASGDMAAAAQAQLNIRQLNLEYQKQQALAALEEKRNEDIKKQEAEKEKVQERIAKLQKEAARLAKIAAEAQQKANSIAAIQQSIAMTLSAASITNDAAKLKQLADAYKSDIAALSKLDKTAAAALTPPATVQTVTEIAGQKITTKGEPDYLGALKGATKYTLDEATKDAYKNFGIDVEAFGVYVAKLTGSKALGSAKTADTTTLAGKTTGSGTSTKYYDASGKVITKEQYQAMPLAPKSGTAYKVPLPANSRTRTGVFTNAADLIQQFLIDNGQKTSIDSTDGFTFDQNGTVKKNGKLVGYWYSSNSTGSMFKAYARGGMIRHFGPGGDVNGAGTSTSDSIPAYLSNGEYVIRASSVEKYGKELFDGLNAQKFAGGGIPNPISLAWGKIAEAVSNVSSKITTKISDIGLNQFLGVDDFTRAFKYTASGNYGKASKSALTGLLEGGTTLGGTAILKPLKYAFGPVAKLAAKPLAGGLLGKEFSKAANIVDDFRHPEYSNIYNKFGDTLSRDQYGRAKTNTALATAILGSAEKSRALNALMHSFTTSAAEGKDFATITGTEAFQDLMIKAGMRPEYVNNFYSQIGYLTRKPVEEINQHFASELAKINFTAKSAQSYLKSPLTLFDRLKDAAQEASAVKKSGFSVLASGNSLDKILASKAIPQGFKNLIETNASRTRSKHEDLITKLLHPMDVPVETGRAYGPGTYFARTLGLSNDLFRNFGENIYKANLSIPAMIKVFKSKGYIPENVMYEKLAAAGHQSLTNMPWEHEFIQGLMNEGYIGFKHREALTSWLTGTPGFGLKPTLKSSTSVTDKINKIRNLPKNLTSASSLLNVGIAGRAILPFLDNIAAGMYGQTQNKAQGGYINPKFNIPTPKPNIVNPAMMGYNKGGSVHRYDVGGLVINAAPNHNTNEIAKAVVNIMEERNLREAASLGRTRTV